MSTQIPVPVDVLIVTALTLEQRAVLTVEDGALPGSRWEDEPSPLNLPFACRSFAGHGGRPLRIGVTQAPDMGTLAVASALLPLIEPYRPRCIAMTGVCAGRPKKTGLGDVIAAERLFFHDTGKQLPGEVDQDVRTYNLRDDWKIALEHFDWAARFKDAEWLRARPIPMEWQEAWVLAQLVKGAEPLAHPERTLRCPQWTGVMRSLWKNGLLADQTLELTEKGRKQGHGVLIEYGGALPELSPFGSVLPFRVHVAPMGSGNKVVEDEKYWSFVSDFMRKSLGLEMEAVAIGAISHAQRHYHLDALVMKSVMDFANHGRDDHFKEFAARAAAECLIAFLRERMVERAGKTSHGQDKPGSPGQSHSVTVAGNVTGSIVVAGSGNRVG